MSGPKSSTYTLTLEQRRLLAEQRKREMRRRAALAQIKSSRKEILKIKSTLENKRNLALELENHGLNSNGTLNVLSDMERVIGEALNIEDKVVKDDLSSLETSARNISDKLVHLRKQVSLLDKKTKKNEEQLYETTQQSLENAFMSQISVVSLQKQASRETEQTYTKEIDELGSLLEISYLPIELQEKIKSTMKNFSEVTDKKFARNYIALSVLPLIKECKSFINEYEEHFEEFEELDSKYKALCEMSNFSYRETICSTESIKFLKEEIKRIEESIEKDEEEAYISQCIDEVMSEMGYTVIGNRNVVKKNGKHFRHELFHYGDGIAVDVTYASDGQITMELGGMDINDRLPDSSETKMLCDRMEDFCDDFKEVERRLLKKGVVLAKRLSLLPPDETYAQIINISDYTTQQTVERISVNSKRKQKTKTQSQNGVKHEKI